MNESLVRKSGSVIGFISVSIKTQFRSGKKNKRKKENKEGKDGKSVRFTSTSFRPRYPRVNASVQLASIAVTRNNQLRLFTRCTR